MHIWQYDWTTLNVHMCEPLVVWTQVQQHTTELVNVKHNIDAVNRRQDR